MYINEDLTVNIYDTITADQDITEGDQVFIFDAHDPLEVTESFDEGDTIMVRGYSHKTGDTATYFLRPDTEVGLWTA
jgi:hypothetical protein